MLRMRRRPQDSIPTSSMADVAFLLLVFFLVTTVFPKDRGLALVLPQGEVNVSQSNVLHFLIDSNETLAVQFGENPQQRRIRPADVESVWRSAVASTPGLIAAVKTGQAVRYGAMVDVLDALQAAGATRVSLQILPN
jgi:biopolymer transport protein ExbD